MFVGANVENASYGLAQCAERSAIGAAVAAGATRFVAIAIASPGARPATPCGMCRQVLAEFPPAFAVRCVAERGEPVTSDVAALLPAAFGPAELEAAERTVERTAKRTVERTAERNVERKAERTRERKVDGKVDGKVDAKVDAKVDGKVDGKVER